MNYRLQSDFQFDLRIKRHASIAWPLKLAHEGLFMSAWRVICTLLILAV